ncbi:MAG TPA: FdhF/YdeP family oxidoreductase [Saprospiraceae bacterium]|nr:FdhF/YdeP family oxidoreductase [Saprospiraceae bacterium]HPI07325.1 FdhF/YdeP family oxidoreductase [Saprospiraceae bacterium]
MKKEIEQTDPQAENPETFTGIKRSHPGKTAGGLPAVLSSMKHVFGAMDVPRGLKALSKLNQMDGYDCPGCAWPDPDDERSGIAEYCENGAKAIAEEATTKKLDAAFFAENSVSALSELSDFEIGKKGRIAQPMYLPAGATHYQPISWDAAFEKIARHLKILASPDEAVFYTSGRTSNEAAFLYQLFVRKFGTNNLPDCSNMCHESSGVALGESLGIGKGSVTLEDFYETDVIVILGQNPGTNHPRMLTALQKAKEHGAKIISVNPLKETGLLGFSHPQQVKGLLGMSTELTDVYLQVKINGDMALLKALAILMLEAEERNPGTVFDADFIREHTAGAKDYLQSLKQYDLEDLSLACGVPLPQIKAAADLLIGHKKIIACWAMGLTQHKNAVDTIKEIVNLLLLKGSIGKPGAGTCPVRGHSNVQGDRTMGIYERPQQAFLDRLEKTFNFRPPQEPGYDVVECIHAMHEGKGKVFFAMGGNFLSATPDTQYTAEALRRCDLTVQVSTKLNRSHLVHGKEAIILPCLGRTDRDMTGGTQQFVSVENSMGVVHSSKGNLQPVSDDLLSEPAIVCQLAKAVLGNDSGIEWDIYQHHYDHIRTDIERAIPGFDNYNERVREPGGFYLPNAARLGRFNTESGKANFNLAEVPRLDLEPDEFIMMTIRSHDQFNTTIYGLDDRYRGIFHERRVILMNPFDIGQAGLKDGDVVDLFNYSDGVERVARKFIVVAYDIPERCTATYFPETNVLVPIKSTAEKSNTPTSKMVVIKIRSEK